MRRAAGVIAICAALLGYATVHNVPVNVPLSGSVADSLRIGARDCARLDDILVSLACSGGGTRAAAFSFGVLEEMNGLPLRGASGALIDRIDFISGVSGGSVTAAYYGLKKCQAQTDFREWFLLRNAEEGLDTMLSLATLGRALGGAVNDQTGFTRWSMPTSSRGRRLDRCARPVGRAAGSTPRTSTIAPRSYRLFPAPVAIRCREAAIAAGRDALRASPALRGFLSAR